MAKKKLPVGLLALGAVGALLLLRGKGFGVTDDESDVGIFGGVDSPSALQGGGIAPLGGGVQTINQTLTETRYVTGPTESENIFIPRTATYSSGSGITSANIPTGVDFVGPHQPVAGYDDSGYVGANIPYGAGKDKLIGPAEVGVGVASLLPSGFFKLGEDIMGAIKKPPKGLVKSAKVASYVPLITGPVGIGAGAWYDVTQQDIPVPLAVITNIVGDIMGGIGAAAGTLVGGPAGGIAGALGGQLGTEAISYGTYRSLDPGVQAKLQHAEGVLSPEKFEELHEKQTDPSVDLEKLYADAQAGKTFDITSPIGGAELESPLPPSKITDLGAVYRNAINKMQGERSARQAKEAQAQAQMIPRRSGGGGGYSIRPDGSHGPTSPDRRAEVYRGLQDQANRARNLLGGGPQYREKITAIPPKVYGTPSRPIQ
jgi:hypothetical protein